VTRSESAVTYHDSTLLESYTPGLGTNSGSAL